MHLNKSAFLVIVFALLIAACENKTAQNVSVNPNSAENSASGQNSVNVVSNTNKTANETSAENSNTDRIKDDTADFEGTAGIIDKKHEINEAPILKEVRTAGHANYDRAVFEFEGEKLPGYHIEYIDKPVRACGSGNAVSLKGDGWLEIRFQPARSHTDEGNPTIRNPEQNPNHAIIRQLKSTCDFEADVTWILGVSSPNKYRVIELKNPARLVIDIKH